MPEPTGNKKWYVIKVQSGREDTIREAIERKVKIEPGMDQFFGQIIVPVERTVELVKGKKVTRTRKLYPGYIMAEVEKILNQKKEVVAEAPVAHKIDFSKGEHIKVKDGMFAGMEGEVSEILEAKGLVRVMLKIFGRDVPVELEYWQVEHA